jgi:putative glutamine amidotransferase
MSARHETAPVVKPLVGIPQCLDDRGRWKPGRDYLYIDFAYARAVESAGGIPLHLPMQRDADALLDRIDALILPGGDDLPPPPESHYPSETVFDFAPAAQVEFDTRLLDGALARGLPILGICYGMQLLALHHGGALHYHLPHDLPDADCHQLSEAEGRHAISAEPGTRTAAVFGEGPTSVNSLHHQAVASPGAGVRVSALAEDGVIEAIELSDDRFALGVQWHPEKLADSSSRSLFAALLSAARSRPDVSRVDPGSPRGRRLG